MPIWFVGCKQTRLSSSNADRMLVAMALTAKIDLAYLQAAKHDGRKFSVLTCYDVATARLMEAAGVEVLLVGDTAGEVVLGLPATRDINPEFLIELTAAVRRGAPHAFLVADLPHACRSEDIATTISWCQRFSSETGCDAVKIEVAAEDVDLVRRVHEAGVPVVAHVGLLPQYVDAETGYRAQARDADGAAKLIAITRAMELAGASVLLLEAVASEVAHDITLRAQVPVIGCVAGPHCDGTVVVLHDMIGLGGGHPPRAVKRYENLADIMTNAFRHYVADIHAGEFPVEKDAIHMKPGEHDKLKEHYPE